MWYGSLPYIENTSGKSDLKKTEPLRITSDQYRLLQIGGTYSRFPVLFPHCHRDGESPHWVLTYFVYDSFLPLNFPLSDSCGNVFLLSRFFAFPFRGSCVLTSRFNLWLCFWMVSVGQLKCKRAWGEIDETNPEAGCGRTCLRHT